MPSSKIWFSPQLQPKSCAAPSLAVSCDVVVLDEMQRSPSADQFTQIRGDAVAWSPLRLSMDKLVGGSQPAGVAAPTAQDAEQTVVHATPLWSKAAGPLEQVHGEVDWRARPATAPAATRRPRVVDAMAKKLLFQDPVQDLETELPSLMVAVGEEILKRRVIFHNLLLSAGTHLSSRCFLGWLQQMNPGRLLMGLGRLAWKLRTAPRAWPS